MTLACDPNSSCHAMTATSMKPDILIHPPMENIPSRDPRISSSFSPLAHELQKDFVKSDAITSSSTATLSQILLQTHSELQPCLHIKEYQRLIVPSAPALSSASKSAFDSPKRAPPPTKPAPRRPSATGSTGTASSSTSSPMQFSQDPTPLSTNEGVSKTLTEAEGSHATEAYSTHLAAEASVSFREPGPVATSLSLQTDGSCEEPPWALVTRAIPCNLPRPCKAPPLMADVRRLNNAVPQYPSYAPPSPSAFQDRPLGSGYVESPGRSFSEQASVQPSWDSSCAAVQGDTAPTTGTPTTTLHSAGSASTSGAFAATLRLARSVSTPGASVEALHAASALSTPDREVHRKKAGLGRRKATHLSTPLPPRPPVDKIGVAAGETTVDAWVSSNSSASPFNVSSLADDRALTLLQSTQPSSDRVNTRWTTATSRPAESPFNVSNLADDRALASCQARNMQHEADRERGSRTAKITCPVETPLIGRNLADSLPLASCQARNIQHETNGRNSSRIAQTIRPVGNAFNVSDLADDRALASAHTQSVLQAGARLSTRGGRASDSTARSDVRGGVSQSAPSGGVSTCAVRDLGTSALDSNVLGEHDGSMAPRELFMINHDPPATSSIDQNDWTNHGWITNNARKEWKSDREKTWKQDWKGSNDWKSSNDWKKMSDWKDWTHSSQWDDSNYWKDWRGHEVHNAGTPIEWCAVPKIGSGDAKEKEKHTPFEMNEARESDDAKTRKEMNPTEQFEKKSHEAATGGREEQGSQEFVEVCDPETVACDQRGELMMVNCHYHVVVDYDGPSADFCNRDFSEGQHYLKLSVGDRLIFLRSEGPWAFGHETSSAKEGWFPPSYVVPDDEEGRALLKKQHALKVDFAMSFQ